MATDTRWETTTRTHFDVSAGDGEWFDAVHAVHQRMLQEMDLSAVEKLDAERAREAVKLAARQLVTQQFPSLLGDDREHVIRRVIDEAVGFGPVQPLIDDDSVSEVMVNAPEEIFFERDGIIFLSPLRFRDNGHIMRIIERIIAPLGRRVDESSPYVDARLPDGSRVNIVIPPLVPRSPTVTIRKFRREKYKMPDLVGNGTLTEPIATFLEACVSGRLNVMISGGTGTGKTTLLNALSNYISNAERVISIEDPIEMMLQQSHVIAMEARPANIEGRNEVTQRDLVRNALRMRPDRIIVGEVRGAEAFDMLTAMNTGHEGSLTTVHANSPRDALIRIENMVLMAGFDLPVRAIREQIAAALHIIVQIARFPDGKRRVTHITEITGREGDTVTTQDLFVFQQERMDADGRVVGHLEPTGIVPTFIDEFARNGVVLDMGLRSPAFSGRRI
ncbi:MAG: CpaF family protein [Dehalococcoidia bacterium]|nr:CpaF family protein [Dehalococcoidia bacterium]